MTVGRLLLFAGLLGGVCAGCTQFPALDATQTDAIEGAEYPALVPLDPLLARAAEPGSDPVQTEADLSSRLAALRGRAEALRGPVLTNAERKRLEEGLR